MPDFSVNKRISVKTNRSSNSIKTLNINTKIPIKRTNIKKTVPDHYEDFSINIKNTAASVKTLMSLLTHEKENKKEYIMKFQI